MINVIIVMKEQNFIFYKFHGKYDIMLSFTETSNKNLEEEFMALQL